MTARLVGLLVALVTAVASCSSGNHEPLSSLRPEAVVPVVDLPWEAAKIQRELDGENRTLVRLTLHGREFPQRALEPFVRVGGMRSLFVELEPGGTAAAAYFAAIPPDGGAIEVGWGEEVDFTLVRPFESAGVHGLAPRKIP